MSKQYLGSENVTSVTEEADRVPRLVPWKIGSKKKNGITFCILDLGKSCFTEEKNFL